MHREIQKFRYRSLGAQERAWGEGDFDFNPACEAGRTAAERIHRRAEEARASERERERERQGRRGKDEKRGRVFYSLRIELAVHLQFYCLGTGLASQSRVPARFRNCERCSRIVNTLVQYSQTGEKKEANNEWIGYWP